MGRHSNLRWACATVVPWALAAGLLVSFTAVASNDPKAGISAGPAYRQGALPEARLVSPAGIVASASLRLPAIRLDEVVPEAALAQLRHEAKADVQALPEVTRSRKGAALPALRPSLSRRGIELARLSPPVSQRLAFARDERILPPTVLMPGSVEGPDWEASRSLEPWSGEDPTVTTRNSSSVQSPRAAAAGSTGASRGPARLSGDGATPTTSRALALASTTPAAVDNVPLAIAAAPVSLPLLPQAQQPEARPRYADLIAPGSLEREQRCLAEAVYFEARSEPEDGQAAVAQVVLNRVRSGLYPASVCGVVYQNRHRHLACQFTFACEGKALRVTDAEAWETAKRVARDVTEGRTYLTDVGGATHYHADYVRPYWAKRLKKMDVIGRHIFYQLRPGQT
ncbi:cell wall hydrolase [Enterovirga aerilata]|uniref:Cell wall hydrolase n=1 Tax=Enterovirga aerilata TaxID=2730920 RepID=A0A849I4D7_9HYPH|nr:cell wall hydrolase [Enterovirga sp. DB1703]NNM72228.1 cell wall hydrolase [Enterovirga sp. DB1703]